MKKNSDFDILIVGSGPSGVQAASEALKKGLKVGLVEIGYTDDHYHKLIPPKPFSEIRKTDPNQGSYFLGDNPEQAFQSQAKAGAHLTPPRSHMIRDMEKLFPTESETFSPLQSTACGGLGVSWGANVFSLEDFELKRIGINPDEMKKFYRETSEEVGVSGQTEDSLAPLISNHLLVQPPLVIDTNAQKILDTYQKKQKTFLNHHFYLGQSLVAVLTKQLVDRKPNPYWDMDFWSDLSQSVYRPIFTLRELKRNPLFTHIPKKIALKFENSQTSPSHVFLHCRDMDSGSFETLNTKRLILAAGAINSGKLAHVSLNSFNTPMPILCNPNHWVAAVHLPMLGRKVEDARYSLAQLTALQRTENDPEDYVLGQFYSYRSLLYSRLLSNLPLPPALGLPFLRFLITSFTCVNLHFSDKPTPRKWLKVKQRGEETILQANYERTPDEETELRQNEKRFVRALLGLNCIPLGINRPAHGASIHYAGTLPFSDESKPLTCEKNGKLRGFDNVYVADGSTWNFMPAKGLTFSLMAGARRIAAQVIEGFKF